MFGFMMQKEQNPSLCWMKHRQLQLCPTKGPGIGRHMLYKHVSLTLTRAILFLLFFKPVVIGPQGNCICCSCTRSVGDYVMWGSDISLGKYGLVLKKQQIVHRVCMCTRVCISCMILEYLFFADKGVDSVRACAPRWEEENWWGCD